MQKTEETEKTRHLTDCFMPVDKPAENKAYQMLKWYEKEILFMVAFTVPTLESRDHMNAVRDKLKHVACNNCIHMGKNKRSKLNIQTFPQDEQLTKFHLKIVKVETWTQSKKETMACEGCRGLRLKQIATGYIKGRRFKQV